MASFSACLPDRPSGVGPRLPCWALSWVCFPPSCRWRSSACTSLFRSFRRMSSPFCRRSISVWPRRKSTNAAGKFFVADQCEPGCTVSGNHLLAAISSGFRVCYLQTLTRQGGSYEENCSTLYCSHRHSRHRAVRVRAGWSGGEGPCQYHDACSGRWLRPGHRGVWRSARPGPYRFCCLRGDRSQPRSRGKHPRSHASGSRLRRDTLALHLRFGHPPLLQVLSLTILDQQRPRGLCLRAVFFSAKRCLPPHQFVWAITHLTHKYLCVKYIVAFV